MHEKVDSDYDTTSQGGSRFAAPCLGSLAKPFHIFDSKCMKENFNLRNKVLNKFYKTSENVLQDGLIS